MIITRTPFRVSFFGGGTDYPGWYKEHGGAVLSTTINKYCWLTARHLPPFHEHRFRIVYRKIELCQDIEEIEHQSVRAVLEELQHRRSLELHHDGDLPARSGMGSSSAFTVGLLHAIYAISGKIAAKRQLAMDAIRIEQEVLNEVVGSQDQVAVAYGGLNQISFFPDGQISVHPMTLTPSRVDELQAHLMLFYTSIRRTASSVAQSYVNELSVKKRNMRLMREFVDEAVAILSNGSTLDAFGELLHESWMVKKDLSDLVSNDAICAIYDEARKAGAIGGKITGAGGGGFMLLFAPPDRQGAIRKALADLIYVPIKFDHEGSKVVYYEPGEDFEELDMLRVNQTVRSPQEHDILYGQNQSTEV